MARMNAAIGQTPLARVDIKVEGVARRVFLKLESFNQAGGSLKARTAQYLLADLVRHGVGRDNTIVESSSGNLGVALALQARQIGASVIVVVDPNTTARNLRRIRATEARVEVVDSADASGSYLHARLQRVHALIKQIPGSVTTNQYSSAANPRAHYEGTGREILRDVPDVSAITVPCSTGGTCAGIAARVRAEARAVEVVPVDVPASSAIRPGYGHRVLVGIGSPFPSQYLEERERKRAIFIEDGVALAASRILLSEVGVSVGGSSGAAFVAALRWLQKHPDARTVVAVCPDSAAGYDLSQRRLHSLGAGRLLSLADLAGRLAHDGTEQPLLGRTT